MKKIVFFILISFKCFSQTEIYDYEWLAMCDAGETNFYRLVLHNPSYGWDSVILTRQYTATPAGFTNYSPSGPVTMGQCVTGGGGGCCETASNVGTDGYGVYEGQTGLNFKFRNIAPGSGKIIVTLDTSQKDIDIDVNIDSLVGISIDQIDSLRYYLGRAQDNILWRYENINVGTAGQWDTVNVDDDYLTLSGSGGKINISHKESIGSLNGLDTMHQNMVTTENGSNFTIASSGNTHEFNLPVADVSTTGKLSAADWYSFFLKVDTSRKILTTSPITGGGNLSIDRTHSLANGTYGDINATSNWQNLKVMGVAGRPLDSTGIANDKIWKYNSSLGEWQIRDDSIATLGTIYYQNVTEQGVGFASRPTLNFIRDNDQIIHPDVDDDSGNNKTDVKFYIFNRSIGNNKLDTMAVDDRVLDTTGVDSGNYINTDLTVTSTGRISQAANGSNHTIRQADTLMPRRQYIRITGPVTVYDTAATSTTHIAISSQAQPTIITPSNITVDQDNYSPTGWDAARIVRIQCDTGMRAITSFAATTNSGELIKTLYNIGNNPIIIPPEHPDGTASNRITSETDNIIFPKSSIDIMYDTITDRWLILNVNNRVYYNRNFFQEYTPASITAADWGFWGFTTSNGAVSIIPSGGAIRAPGGIAVNNTSQGGRAYVYCPKNLDDAATFGDGYISLRGTVYIGQDTSNPTDRYFLSFSLTDNAGANTQFLINNSISIIYCDSINSGNWSAACLNNSGNQTTIDLGVDFTAATITDLEVIVDKMRSEARFFINGVYRGRITTNLPSTVGSGARVGFLKTVGSASRYWTVNNLKYNYIYTR